MKYFIYIVTFFTVLIPARLMDIPISLTQPDGEIFSCYTSGDEYYHWLHDEEGFTIIQNERNGYYYYAIKDNNIILPSNYLVNEVVPSEVGLIPKVIINKEDYLDKRNLYWDNIERRDAPSIGIINNLNVFIRFAEEQEFSNSRNYYDGPFNLEEGPSMLHYFKEVSYDLLTVKTEHFPECETSDNISYQDQYTRDYYQPYNEVTNPIGYQNDNQARTREHDLLKNAIEFIENEVPEDLDIDANDDGYVDNVTFLVKGSPGAWADLLWPHRWALYTHQVYINGSRVYDYNLNLEQGGYFTVGTLCHEFFHSLGAPDLYHYYDETSPVAVGGWDVMDASSDIPQSMSAYMKYRYTDWITELPVIEYGGRYDLFPLSATSNNIYRINSPLSNQEYFVLEYRVKEGLYEINTPGGDNGLLIYRVNSTLSGNANGPPDELYVYRMNGTPTTNGIFSGAVFNAENGRITFNDNTNPSSFLYDGSTGGINITNVSEPGDVISFDIVNMILLPDIIGVSFDEDSDNVINPDEEIIIDIMISNLSDFNAQDVTAIITSSDNNLEIINDEIYFNNIISSYSSQSSIIIDLSPLNFGLTPFNIEINANYLENNQSLTYVDNFQFELDINLYQSGFPYSTINEIHSSPIICDLDLNGEKEIIFGDHFGVIRAINFQGQDVLSNIFPFETGNQIWGAPALADIDLDGYDDLIVVSKNKYIYAFDYNGLKWLNETNSQLIATPTIGNFNNDNQLEVIVSGYTNDTNNLYVFSHAGEQIDFFQTFEKNKSGFAIADINGNEVNDIVFGTDANNLYLIYDGNQIANGFPFSASDKFRLAPTILKNSDEFTIIAPCKNKTLYAINESGLEKFSIEFEHAISTSASILEYQNLVTIFIGLNNGDIYGFNESGDLNYFHNIQSKVIGEIIFSDLNADGNPEIIAVNDIGQLYVLNLDGSVLEHFPINYNFPFSSSPIIDDIDNDNDLEIISGTTNSLIGIDIKSIGASNEFWSMYRFNNQRSNFYEKESACNIGDLNFDSAINILDVVVLLNTILNIENVSDDILCTSDLNIDGEINIQDVVLLINYIFESY